jgi:hypothetical protein
MSDLFDILARNIQIFSNRFAKHGKYLLQSALSHGEKFGRMGKTKIEIEKIKWELKRKHNELGQYVAEKKVSNSVTDFSHDKYFLELVNDINRITSYIKELKQEKESNYSLAD